MLTITGGKWTTYRRMAEDCIDQAATLARLPERDCPTVNLAITADTGDDPVRQMARTVEDVLARRRRTLFLDARAAMAEAPAVAAQLARQLGRPPGWAEAQTADFLRLAAGYLPAG